MDTKIKTVILYAMIFFFVLVSNAVAIGFVQVNSATPQTAQSSVTVTYKSAQAAGDLNIVVVGWNDSTAAVASVTDSKGNVYQLAVGPTVQTGVASQSVYFAKNIAGATANGNTVTVRFNATARYADVRIFEYSGLDGTNPVDVVTASQGNSSTSNSGTVTTGNANDLLFAANLVQTSTISAGTGFTSRIITFPDGDIAEDRIVSATGTYSATASLGTAGPWIMQMVAFKAGSVSPDLTISKTDTGTFTRGQTGAAYTITVTNSGSASTSGTVTVTDALPTGLTATAISGIGWTCTLANVTCTRSNALAASASYPAITLTVNVASNAPATVINTATVSGGGDTNTANNTASAATSVFPAGSPDLTISKTHTGTFTQGQTGAAYTITVTNSGSASTSGTVTVIDTLPFGLVATAISGTGWTCPISSLTCTRSDALAASASYPAITLTVNVASNAPATVTNTATVSGGGDTNTANNTASDATTVGKVTSSGLVAAYSFNEGSGGTVADASGNGNTGTIANATWTGAGKYGSALVFNGTSARITINDSASLHLTTGMTLEAWVNPSIVSNAWRDVIYKGNDNYFLEGTSSAGSVPAGGGTFGGAGSELYGTTALPVNTWTHLAVTYDGAALRLYVNGTQVSSLARTGSILTSTNPLQIGGNSIYGQYFRGMIDEVRIYNTALTIAQIQADMGAPIGSGNPLSDPTISKTHAGVFTQGQIGATYTLTVTNVGTGPTTGLVEVTDTLPIGLTATALSGTGWTCTLLGTLTCTRSDELATSASYPAITLTVDVAGDAPSGNVTNTATVSGGGDTNTANNTASDVAVIVTSTPISPLSISTNGRYLVDQNDTPFLIVGDSPQALIANLSTADADMYFANRQAAGFNTVWINLLCATYTAGRADGSTYDGIIPFTTPNDLLTPNEAYFSRVDDMIRLAANHGLTVFLDPAETGSWLSVLRSNGLTKARNYGRFLGNRYKSFDNIVWMSGNDFQSWQNPSDDALVRAVALGIKDNDTRHIHTVELNYLVSGSLDDSTWAPIISLDAAYTYYPTYAKVLDEYNRSSFLPVFMVEANYEFESQRGYLTTPGILRRQEYWTMLSGAAGQLYGNYYTWTFSSGWQNNLDTPGVAQLGYNKALFASRPWYNLVPDQNHTTVTAGYGTYSATGEVNTNDYMTAARTPDGALVIAYMPTLRTITVDMSKLSGLATARWYDPSNGTYVIVTGSPFTNVGTRRFVPPGNNHDGSGDWVLVLETSS